MKKQEKLDIVDKNDNVIGKDTRENIFKKGLKNKSKFKPDFPIVFQWYLKNVIGIKK